MCFPENATHASRQGHSQQWDLLQLGFRHGQALPILLGHVALDWNIAMCNVQRENCPPMLEDFHQMLSTQPQGRISVTVPRHTKHSIGDIGQGCAGLIWA